MTSSKICKVALIIVDDVHKLFTLCANLEWIDEKDPERRTLAHEILYFILATYLRTVTKLYTDDTCYEAGLWQHFCLLQHRGNTELVQPFFAQTFEWREHEEPKISRESKILINLLGGSLVDLMGDRFSEAIDECVENPTYEQIGAYRKSHTGGKHKHKQHVWSKRLVWCRSHRFLPVPG